MNFLSSLILFASYLTTHKVSANVACIDVSSLPSATSDDARAIVICPSTHATMVSCGGSTVDGGDLEFDGAGINLPSNTYPIARCIAQNAHQGNGVIAHARCCNFEPQDIECEYILSPRSSNGDDDIITQHCGLSYPIMTHCSAFTYYASTDGAYPGPESQKPSTIPNYDYDVTNFPPHTQCTAQNGANSEGTYANLACCRSPTYDLTCITRYGAPSQLSQVECPEDYFMAGCSGWGVSHAPKYVS